MHHICKNCQKQFKSEKRDSKFCNRECYKNGRTVYKFICKYCTNPSTALNKTVQYCSRRCKRRCWNREKSLAICEFCKYKFLYYKHDKQSYNKKFCNAQCHKSYNKDPRYKKTIEQSIEVTRAHYEKYVIRNPEGCWGWSGPINENGYGKSSFQTKTIGSHRAAWLICYGELPEGKFVCHSCDNPICTNPKHLFLGDALLNVHDMMKKGRKVTPRGIDRGHVKLTNEQVFNIKRLLEKGVTGKDIAKLFNVSRSTISKIKISKLWTHIL